MRRIHLVPVGALPAGTLQELEPGLTKAFGAACSVDPEGLDARFAYHPERQQHHATEILSRLAIGIPRGHGPAGAHGPQRWPSSPAGASHPDATRPLHAHPGAAPQGGHDPPGSCAPYPGAWRVLGVTAADLYIPILTFVFGEAQLEGRCAVVSMHRLRQEFYGLPADPALLAERLLKEAVHELGHTLGLVHCPDRACAMASSHGVELIDLKGSRLCAACASAKETTAFDAGHSTSPDGKTVPAR